MEKRVSKRHTNTTTHAWSGVFRNSESSGGPDASQLLPIWPKDLSDRTRAGRQNLIAIIERELRKERRRGIAGNRAYDISRHAKLVQLLKAERDELLALTRLDAVSCARRAATHVDLA